MIPTSEPSLARALVVQGLALLLVGFFAGALLTLLIQSTPGVMQ